MTFRLSLAIMALVVPTISFAAVFPAQSLWLSDTKPNIGENVRMYAVIYNNSDSDVSGSLTFLVDGKQHDQKTSSLKSGESVVLSTTWNATVGDHSFSAKFSGGGADASTQTSATVSIVVDPPPSQLQQTVTQARDVGTQLASTSLPILSTVANKVYETTESIRNAGIIYLEEAADSASEPEPDANPSVLGTSTQTLKQVEGFDRGSAGAGTTGMFAKAKSTAAAGALYAFKSLWLFYPLLVLLLLIIFRWLYKWVTRPRF